MINFLRSRRCLDIKQKVVFINLSAFISVQYCKQLRAKLGTNPRQDNTPFQGALTHTHIYSHWDSWGKLIIPKCMSQVLQTWGECTVLLGVRHTFYFFINLLTKWHWINGIEWLIYLGSLSERCYNCELEWCGMVKIRVVHCGMNQSLHSKSRRRVMRCGWGKKVIIYDKSKVVGIFMFENWGE